MSKQILCTHEAEGVQKKKKISKYFILFLYLVEGKRNKEKKKMTEIVSDKISLYENKHRIIHNLSQHVLQKKIS